ncbi:hypothetical protein EGJ22_06860 [Pseudomonas sp. p99-361]|uniref:hypothetical protein n=1 Tax=Pseudomonas TaxID=286 RepID=UPI0004A6C15D|nr:MULTISPECIES: hypothetical protein [Pseudomonas]MDH1551820.1 hypothetical protein [Pseudomonas juntendi]QEQ87185.1 hypothetical protein F1602_07520 [Pseudomonas putida]RRV21015.1 hypothetical protein EGJ22_06860 [Pseudomonas sp. p99-361]
MSNTGHFAAYEPDGRIVFAVSCPPEYGKQIIRLNTDRPFIQVATPARPAEHFVVGQMLKERPQMGAVLQGLWLKGVHEGAAVNIESETYTADGSDIELGFSAPGIYTVTVSLWPYRDQEFTVENSA